MTTTSTTADRALYVERILEAFGQSFRAETPTATQDAIETAHRWAEAADQDGVDVYGDLIALEEQARQAWLATL